MPKRAAAMSNLPAGFDFTQFCPHTENCPVFRHFGVFTREVYRELYCLGDYDTCARYELKERCETVPPDLLPTGKRIQRK